MFGFRTAFIALMGFFTIVCPFSKVEESFNMQAMHDLVFVRGNLSKYDHIDFPGVVPRTFIGSVLVDLVTAFPLYLCILFGFPKFISQLIVRLGLGLFNVLCFSCFCTSVRQKFGRAVYVKLCLTTLTQFHLFFYMSRSLPNTFAMAFVLLSFSYLLLGRDKEFVILSGFAILVFRSELLLLYGPCLLYGLACGNVRLRPSLILTVILTAIASVAISVLVDSFFWQKIIWPEGIVFYFNTILNKSSQWGRFPFHWYFTSALPRALLSTYTLVLCWIPFSLWSLIAYCYGRQKTSFHPASIGLVLAGFAFVTLYSILPHKELRFVIYALPLFNFAAAVVWTFFQQTVSRLQATNPHQKKTSGRKFLWKLTLFRIANLTCYIHLVVNMVGTAVMLLAARENYPGGKALMQLNRFSGIDHETDVHVHICNLAAQTGVTRFLEEHDNWIYNKTEGIENNVKLLEQSSFTHLISEIKPVQMREKTHIFRPLFSVNGFDGLNVQLSWWPIRFRTSVHLTVYERNK